MRSSRIFFIGALAAGCILGFPSDAHAVCKAVNTSADDALFGVHGCFQEFAMWHAEAYGVVEDAWRARGYHDACNAQLEYAKHWNSSYLLAYGIVFDRGFAGRAFHSGRSDYTEVARARDSDEWHDALTHRVTDALSGGNALARFTYRPFLDNLVETACPLYDFDQGGVPGPAWRASNLVHEGWHAYNDEQGFSAGPNEVKGHFGSELVPLAVRTEATATTLTLARGNFANPPVPVVCGAPSLLAPPRAASGCGSLPACTGSNDCLGICDDGCCIVIK